MSAPDDPAPQPKLNILALPSHTAILFALIVTVVLGAALATLLPGSRLWWPPFVFGLTLLPLRDFLHRPDALRRQRGLEERPDAAAHVIAQELAALAPQTAPFNQAAAAALAPQTAPSEQRASDPPPVRVLTSALPLQMEAFGTYRRRYLGLGQRLAEAVCRGLSDRSEHVRNQYRTMLAHELAHFLNRDIRLTGLAYSLLKMLALVMALDLWVGVVLVAFGIEFGPEVLRLDFWNKVSAYFAANAPGFPVPDLAPVHAALMGLKPEVTAQLADPALRWDNYQHFLLYLAGAQWPFFVAGLVLLLVFWPRLLAVREMYADARAASLVGDSSLIPEAVDIHALQAAPWEPPASSPAERWRNLLKGRSLRPLLPAAGLSLSGGITAERVAALADPLAACGSWRRMAAAAGLAVLLLDLALRSTLAATFVAEPGAHLPFLIGFLTFSTWLLPRTCDGRAGRAPSLKLIAQLVALFTAVKLSLHLLDGLLMAGMVWAAPVTLGRLIDAWVYSLVGASGANLPPLAGVQMTWADFFSLHVVRPVLFYLLLMPPVLIAALWLDLRIRQRVLTWHRAGERVKTAFWRLTAALALVLALVVVPVLNHLVFPEIYTAWSAAALVGLAGGLVALGWAAVWFVRQDRAEHARCANPACDARLTGPFALGAECPQCHTLLHPWLIAAYDAAPVMPAQLRGGRDA